MRPDRLHQEEALFLGQGDHALRLGIVGGEGFFTEDMFAGSKGGERAIAVAGIGSGDVDDIDLRMPKHGLRIGIDVYKRQPQ